MPVDSRNSTQVWPTLKLGAPATDWLSSPTVPPSNLTLTVPEARAFHRFDNVQLGLGKDNFLSLGPAAFNIRDRSEGDYLGTFALGIERDILHYRGKASWKVH